MTIQIPKFERIWCYDPEFHDFSGVILLSGDIQHKMDFVGNVRKIVSLRQVTPRALRTEQHRRRRIILQHCRAYVSVSRKS